MLFPFVHPPAPPMPPMIILNETLEELAAMREKDENGWTPRDYDSVIDEGDAGGWEPEHFGSAIAAESEFQCSQPNRMGSGAKGLTQMMPATLFNLGWRPGHPVFDATAGDYCKAPVAVQLDFAYRYFREWRWRFRLARWRTRAQLYLANFLPADLPFGDRPGFVLAQDQGRRAQVWRQNPGLDANHDGKIVVAEIDLFLVSATTGRARQPYRVFLEGVQRARLRRPAREVDGPIGLDDGLRDVRDIRSLQVALVARGFDVGGVDGVMGPKTRAALVAFQAARGLVQDGIAGVFTWAALSEPLRAA